MFSFSYSLSSNKDFINLSGILLLLGRPLNFSLFVLNLSYNGLINIWVFNVTIKLLLRSKER